HRVEREMRGAERTPLFDVSLPILGRARTDDNPPIDAESTPIAACFGNPATYTVERGSPGRGIDQPERPLREKTVGDAGRAPQGAIRAAADPDRRRLAQWQRIDPRGRHAVVTALEAEGVLGEEPPQHLDLLFQAVAAISKVHAKRLVFDQVPALADTEP